MVTTTRARVYEEINKGLVLSSDLRAQKNSCFPIFRFPPEILADIFIHGARDYYERHNSPSYIVPHTHRVPHWVNVSYVCRYWRNVALDCTTLWTYHFTLSLRWTEELLARSKRASLKICIWYHQGRVGFWWTKLLKKVLKHAERIQELRFDLQGKYLPEELSLYAPRLQILDIRSLDFPSVIKYGEIPPLRTLQLIGCPLPWHSTFNLSGVTTLFLRDIPFPSQLHIMEFLATLSRMQALTVLHLYLSLAGARRFLSSGTFGVSPKVSLPRLARLFVAGPLSTVVALLSCINILLKTQVKLVIGSENSSSVDDYAQLPPVLVQRFSQSKDLSSSGPTIRSLVISGGYQWDFTISASELDDYDPKLSVAYPPQDSSAPLIIVVGMEQSITIRDQIMSDICCAIPSTHVRTLHIVKPPLSPDFWKKTLGHFDGLRRMKLSGGHMPDLVSLLALPAGEPVDARRGDTSSNHDSTPGHTFVPALEELELCGITFRIRGRFARE